MNKPRVVSVGLGPIGLAAARLALEKETLDYVGAVDPAADKAGKDLGALLGKGETGIIVSPSAQEAYEALKPDAIIHCTSSFFPRIVDQLIAAASRGINIVSSSEELLVPDYRHPELFEKVQAAALEGQATILGTGVNPGFAMDVMAATASAVCFDVTEVRCRRVVDAGTRRLPLQHKAAM